MKEVSLDDLKVLVESLDDGGPIPKLKEGEEHSPEIIKAAKEASKNMFKSLLTEIKDNESEIDKPVSYTHLTLPTTD